MSKLGASAPPSIDPTALANAQSQANQNSAQFQSQLNNVNTTSPFGSSTFTQDPTTHQWGLNQSLSPNLQNVFGAQTGLAQMLAGLSPNVAQAATQFTGYGLPTASAGNSFINQASGISPVTSVSMSPAGFNLPPSIAGAGPLQRSLDFSGLTPISTNFSDFSHEIGNAEDAAYRSQAKYLDPQFHQRESDLTQQLADQGIQPGNAAYSRSRGDLGRQENLAYQGAQDAATLAGQQEQARLNAETLAARQQGAGERTTQGQFANQAQGQQFGQNTASAEYQRAADQQVFQQELANAGLNNNEIAQLAGVGSGLLGAGGNAITGGATDLATLMGLGSFGWGGQIPTFGSQGTVVPGTNTVGAANAANTAGMNSFLAGNQLNNQLFNGLGSLGGALGLGGSGGGGLLSAGGLLGSQGPLFGTAADASIAAGGAPLAADAAKAAPLAFSDRLLKEDIHRLGELDSGPAIYSFRYRGSDEPQIGLMADEVEQVRPDAVHTHSSGYKMVDYSKALGAA